MDKTLFVAVWLACAPAMAGDPSHRREIAKKIGASFGGLVFSAGMATAVGLTRDRSDMAWLTGVHVLGSALTVPLAGYLTGAGGTRFTGLGWLVVGLPICAAGGATIGAFASRTPMGRVIAGSAASGLSLAMYQTVLWKY